MSPTLAGENNGTRRPDNEGIAQQIRVAPYLRKAAVRWRHHHALVFKDHPDYRFVLGEKGEVLDIVWRNRAVSLTVS